MPPPTIAVDACAGLHAKQTQLLHVLDRFIAEGGNVLVSSGVYGEMVTMSLSGWLDTHRIKPTRVPRAATNAARNKCRKKRLPGRKDLELVAAAKAADAVLLCHEEAASEAGHRHGLLVVDLPDLVGFARQQEWIDDEQFAEASKSLDEHAWRAPDWAGDIPSTLAGRSAFDRTTLDLRERWQCEHDNAEEGIDESADS